MATTATADLASGTATIKRKRFHTISNNFNFTVTVKSPKHKDGTAAIVEYQVEKDVLTAKSEYFRRSIAFARVGGDKPMVLEDDDVEAMRIWLECMHSADEEGTWAAGAVKDVDITTIWHLVVTGNKYLFDGEPGLRMQVFFEKWYEASAKMDDMDVNFARQLATPCHFFDYAEGFTQITKWLAYNCPGHISELRPIHVKWKHVHLCPPDFVGPMNHARGSLKTCLHRGLWKRVGKLLQEGRNGEVCSHWAAQAGYYFAALVETGVYPLELTFAKRSIVKLLSQLARFDEISNSGGCKNCHIDWEDEVSKAAKWTKAKFDGLCLDCMNKSKFRKGSIDDDYWRGLGAVNGRWDARCRVEHGETSWYVSWCGRDEHRRQLLDTHRATLLLHD